VDEAKLQQLNVQKKLDHDWSMIQFFIIPMINGYLSASRAG
jgi:hypothetical protein